MVTDGPTTSRVNDFNVTVCFKYTSTGIIFRDYFYIGLVTQTTHFAARHGDTDAYLNQHACVRIVCTSIPRHGFYCGDGLLKNSIRKSHGDPVTWLLCGFSVSPRPVSGLREDGCLVSTTLIWSPDTRSPVNDVSQSHNLYNTVFFTPYSSGGREKKKISTSSQKCQTWPLVVVSRSRGLRKAAGIRGNYSLILPRSRTGTAIDIYVWWV